MTDTETAQASNNNAAETAGAQDEKAGKQATEGGSSQKIKKIIVGLILLGIIAFVIVDSLTNKYVKQGFEAFLKWVEANPTAGVFAFMGVYFLATVLFLPGSILTLGSGFVFASAFGLGIGVVLATLAVFFGASAGAIVAFILGRYLLRDWVSTIAAKYAVFSAIDKALEEKGFRIMALLRLSPIIPFNALNYIAGITAVSLVAYSTALFAILPGTILYIFLGATAGSLVDSAGAGGQSKVATYVTIVCGAVFGILGIAATSYYAKKELNKITAEREREANAAASEGEGETNATTTGDEEAGNTPPAE